MLDIDRSDEILDGEFVDARRTGLRRAGAGDPVRALVAESRQPRPDPTFVAQLIATADQAPQTRQPAAGFAGGCADGLWRQPDPAPRHRLPDAADHLAFSAEACPACPARAASRGPAAVPATGFPAKGLPAGDSERSADGAFDRGRIGVTAGVRRFRLGVILQHGFGDRSCRRNRRRRRSCGRGRRGWRLGRRRLGLFGGSLA